MIESTTQKKFGFGVRFVMGSCNREPDPKQKNPVVHQISQQRKHSLISVEEGGTKMFYVSLIEVML